MNLYSIELKVAATLYVKAESENEARMIAEDRRNWGLLVRENQDLDGLPISGCDYDHAPPVSLSPAMTILGPFEDAAVELA